MVCTRFQQGLLPENTGEKEQAETIQKTTTPIALSQPLPFLTPALRPPRGTIPLRLSQSAHTVITSTYTSPPSTVSCFVFKLQYSSLLTATAPAEESPTANAPPKKKKNHKQAFPSPHLTRTLKKRSASTSFHITSTLHPFASPISMDRVSFIR